MDGSGNLYGTTEFGGSGSYGTVYKIDPNGKETVIYNFTNQEDGGEPVSTRSWMRKVTCTALRRRAARISPRAKWDRPTGAVWCTRSILRVTRRHFTNSARRRTARNRTAASSWTRTATSSARHAKGGKSQYPGIAFEIDSSGTYTILHSFVFKNGEEPQGTLLLDPSGALYGTTTIDGNGDGGTIFKLVPNSGGDAHAR